MQLHTNENQPDCQRYICRECGYDVPPTATVCPMCGLRVFRTNHQWQRARAIIRHHAPRADLLSNLRRRAMIEPTRRRVPVNVLLGEYWQAVQQAKELALAGHSQRAVARVQGISKTAARNRLLIPFRVLHAELKRITSWLTPEPTVIRVNIGIDHPPQTIEPRYILRTIRTRYGAFAYPRDVTRYPLRL